jgi:prepilin-type N-terminal cleavage/methylation domain-containing protein
MRRGFTIIELLVVIAIIAVLASSIIISLDIINARGANTAVQTNLGQIRSESLLYRESNSGLFLNLCEADSNPFRIKPQLLEACSRAGVSGASCKCFDDADSWVAAVPLKQGGGEDLHGVLIQTTTEDL